MRDKSLAN
ncbi:hypothetical protein CGLO_00139 [Colletotrichum gloeosporioides Cg-14]|uniref:Uncharacterized protein n=1 Tax=Colletotrichum gloeosporioides (strain Cg-14) TaxID=1237896 RepID=T0L460_COLGC|nr:hypothetical protein CGLO_00139 [Colletotrichum gloeosporioides Cg-14]